MDPSGETPATHRRSRWPAVALIASSTLCVPGCFGPFVSRTSKTAAERPARGKGPDLSGIIKVDSPREHFDPELISPGSGVETWVVHTRACEEAAGSNPWPNLAVGRLDESGGPLHGTDPEALLERMAGRPTVILVHGNAYTYRESTKEAIEIRAKLEAIGGFAPDSLFVIFDWPSERIDRDFVVDLNEKARRARIAGYHLARVLQAAPPQSRICLMGQSDGGRIVLSTTHLLSGAEIRPFLREPSLQLSNGRRDLRIRCIALDSASAHHWLNPGERLEHTLPTCEALLNLPNRCDYALSVYVFGRYTGIKGALGSVGLTHSDRKRIGPLMSKVEEIDHHHQSKFKHTTFPEALTYPDVAPRIAAYTSWGDIQAGKVTR
ncbi:alpha/beta hydrolase [Singulisphaera sp. PoT]|uniref:alpha/beta hydrolase n=1 Tax=Singulisphaera sp. PoT TaxID=3411797 RepID=UPI003BF5D527